MIKNSLLVISTIVLLFLPLFAQKETNNKELIEKAIASKDLARAEKLLNERIALLLSTKNATAVLEYIQLSGKLAQEKSGVKVVGPSLQSILAKIKPIANNDTIVIQAYLDAVDYLQKIGQNTLAVDFSNESMPFAEKAENIKPGYIASVENNLGVIYQRLGDVNKSFEHHLKSLALKEKQKTTEPIDLYKSYNSIASLMWYSSKLDSANYYFEKALTTLSKCEPTAVNKYYRVAIVQNNQSAIYNSLGNISKAMDVQQAAIDNIRAFISSKEPSTQKEGAPVFLYEAIDNLAGYYREIENYEKAKELLFYSYKQKLANTPDQPGVFISELLIGQLLNNAREYTQAETYLKNGLAKLAKSDGDYLFWAGDGYYSLGFVYENTKRMQEARIAFEKSDSLYEVSYQGQYDNIYLDFLRKTAVFYSNTDKYDKAIANAMKGYNYIKKVQGEKSLEAFYQLVNLSEISLTAKKFKEALLYSDQGLAVLKEKIRMSETALDSIKIEFYKPKTILLNAKANYSLEANHDTSFLKQISLQLSEALKLLDKRKSIVDDENSINLMMEDNRDLIDFAKKIALELYQLTKDPAYLDQFIAFHESGLYNRLRSRIDKENAIRFNNIPLSVQKEDDSTKKAIATALNEKDQTLAIKKYTDAVKYREQWLQKLQQNYPAYYNLRYGSLLSSAKKIQASLPANNSLVRFYFTDGQLYALVFSKDDLQCINLGKPSIDPSINTLLTNTEEKKVSPALHELYLMLWKPIEPFIKTEDVIIVPDAVLFSVSFDLLTRQPIRSFSELSDQSLLAKYNFSYQYSPLMIGATNNAVKGKQNYIGFAPGFFENAKKEYASAVKDSIRLDQHYLSLLPQPFTNALLRKMENVLGGDLYLDNQSTVENFKLNAGNHKIVHIGTHSEFNNDKPELSKIVFSKNAGPNKDSNALFLPEIYNCNIQSDLTLLTSCESGKPGYADGEVMVSFAHAFNYAGSKTILTALWKIDEQSTAQITEQFILNLSNNLPAHLALKKAKLAYLQNAQGRMKAPAYWAGLVLLGDSDIVELTKPAGGILRWVLYGAGILALIYIGRRISLSFSKKS